MRQNREDLVLPGLASEVKLPLPVPPAPAGRPVAVSADGNIALAGGADDSAYVFVRSGGVWVQEAKLNGSDAGAGSFFGTAVALAADGSRALVGAYKAPASFCPYAPNTCGAAYVFVRNSGTWIQETKLDFGNDPGLASFGGGAVGLQVSLSDNGATALVSGPFVCSTGEDCGSVAIFQRTGSAWTLEQKVQHSDAESFDAFGISAVLSGDGQTALVGTTTKACPPLGFGCGAAYVFTHNGAAWTQQAKLTPPDPAQDDNFGVDLSLTADGNLAAISFRGPCAAGSFCGAVYLFSRTGSAWSFHQKVQPSDVAAGDGFGTRVALTRNGQNLLASSINHSCAAGMQCGKLYLFASLAGTFAERLGIVASDAAAGDHLGLDVALADDASTVLAQSVDSVYVFTLVERAVVATPTLNEAGLALLALCLALGGAVLLRRRARA